MNLVSSSAETSAISPAPSRPAPGPLAIRSISASTPGATPDKQIYKHAAKIGTQECHEKIHAAKFHSAMRRH